MKLHVLATFAALALASCNQDKTAAARTGGPLESYLVGTKPAGAKPDGAKPAEAAPTSTKPASTDPDGKQE